MSKKKSYGSIFKSSSIMGGSAGIVMIFSMIKVKFAAIFIGTTGVGLLSSFTAIQNLATIIFGLGLNQSAVREIALAHGKNDLETISRSVLTLKRISWFTGIIGMAMVMLLSSILSQITLVSEKYSVDITMIGIIVLLINLSNARIVHLQGIRRIGDIAHINILSAFFAMLSAVLLYWQFGLEGIIPSLVITALLHLLITIYFSSKLPLESIEMSWKESFGRSSSMMQLGVVFMWTGLLGTAVAYVTIVLISSNISIEAVGLYSAAFSLSGMLVNFVLQAMGTDYYPHLTAVSDNEAKMNQLVNEQTEIGLILATPGLIATMVLAPWVIQLFYTDAFLPAVDLIYWFILGAFGRVVSWPLGYVMLAMGKKKMFFFSETSASILNLIFIIIGVNVIGLEGVSIAFFVSYVLYTLIVYKIANHLINFNWSSEALKLLIVFGLLMCFGYVVSTINNIIVSTMLGVFLAIITLVFALRELSVKLGSEHKLFRLLCKVPFLRKSIYK